MMAGPPPLIAQRKVPDRARIEESASCAAGPNYALRCMYGGKNQIT